VAVLTVPFLPIYLFKHVGGGLIVHAYGGYVANTLIPASVVSAFSSAGTTLASLAGGAASIATAPATVVTVAGIAVVAAGAYCYFYGLPLPIESVLANAGLGTKVVAVKGSLLPAISHGAFAVSTTNLATALILLGLASYIAYRFYENHADAARAAEEGPAIDAEGVAKAYFGAKAWQTFGEPISKGLSDASACIVSFFASVATTTADYSEWARNALIGVAAQSTEYLEGVWDKLASRLSSSGKKDTREAG